jgi:Ran GTPase-activating protein (RanGAP) involved in mRNA processing and transport
MAALLAKPEGRVSIRTSTMVLDPKSSYPINRPIAEEEEDEDSSSSSSSSDDEDEDDDPYLKNLKEELQEPAAPEAPVRDLRKEMEAWTQRESAKGPKDYDVKYVIRVQSVVRRLIAKKIYIQRKQMADKRKMVATEIYMTEKNYVAQLGILVDIFLGSLKKMENPPISLDQQKTIFSQVEVILGLSRVLNEELEKRVKAWKPTSKIGDVFNRLKGNFMWYTSYVNNYDAAIQLVHQLEHSSNPFKEWIKKCEANPKVNFQDFASFLILPIQRIPRYEMLVGSLFKATWKEHPDYADLEAAAAAMKAISQQVNKTKKTAEKVSKVLNVQKSIVGKSDLVSPHRRFAKEADFAELYSIAYTVQQSLEKKKSHFTIKRSKTTVLKKVHMVLFNDSLLLSTPVVEEKKKAEGNTRQMYDFEALELLANLDVASPPEYTQAFLAQHAGVDTDISLCFQLTSSSRKYVFAAPSVQALQDWYKDISRACQKAKAVTAKKSTFKNRVITSRVAVTPDADLLAKFNPILEAENHAPTSFNEALLAKDITEVLYAGWVQLQTKSKDSRRLLAISPLRVNVYNVKTEKFELDCHILETKEIISHLPSQLLLNFSKTTLKCTTNDADLAITALQRAWFGSFPFVSPLDRFQIDVRPAARLASVPAPDLSKLACGGIASTYKAITEFYFPFPGGPLPRRDVIWDLENLPHWLNSSELDFNLFENNTGPEYRASFVSLIACLRFNLFFSSLNINGFKFEKPEEWEKVCEAFRYNPRLEKLSAENCQIQGKDLPALLNACTVNKRSALVAINLSENALGDKAVQAFAGWLSHLKTSWHTINFANCKLTKLSVDPLIQAISAHQYAQVTDLNLSHNRLDKTGARFAEWLGKPNNPLKSLVMKECRLPLSNFGAAAMVGCQHLETLDLSGNKFAAADILALAPFLAQTKCIKTLNLSSCGIPPESCTLILETIGSNLMAEKLSLNLASNGLKVEGAAAIAASIVKVINITELNLADNEFGDEGICLLAKGLSDNIGLNKVSLRNAFAGRKHKTITTEDAVGMLIQFIGKKDGVVDLNLSADRLATPARQALYPLLFSLNDSGLTRLDISGNEIGHKGAVILGNILESNQTLKELVWDENSTDLDAFIRFSKSLAYNSTLSSIQLPFVDIQLMQMGEPLREALGRVQETMARNLLQKPTPPALKKAVTMSRRKSTDARSAEDSSEGSHSTKARSSSSSSSRFSRKSHTEKHNSSEKPNEPGKPEKKTSHRRSKSSTKGV